MRSLLAFLVFYGFAFAHVSLVSAANDSDEPNGYRNASSNDRNLRSLVRKHYEKLNPTSKFATGAVVGFAGWRCVENSAMKVIRGTGVAFCVTEILHQTGWANSIGQDIDENHPLQQIQDSIKWAARECRVQMRHHLDPMKLRKQITAYVESDKPGSAGLAFGLLAGLLL
mmetsp:Transcript_4975/g.7351  ORF Transcript_4975/g.7351 Transcript_4975/m.7351 type:complete len:170 (-) Transcript_4975:1583-2092(-)